MSQEQKLLVDVRSVNAVGVQWMIHSPYHPNDLITVVTILIGLILQLKRLVEARGCNENYRYSAKTVTRIL